MFSFFLLLDDVLPPLNHRTKGASWRQPPEDAEARGASIVSLQSKHKWIYRTPSNENNLTRQC